ncbi:mechanosensitive ion channel family protein [Crocosphaera chwakensis]|uniref:MscS Mechanosensitive ion channel n=1 Tax=Crocosphaera chwakensis CCY0110 TaxID=391612 RepID=A3IPW7_9CHRO|nr:mechanosensitive ion channel domain-containing protein [Crocosphaera chwakensis]EAZ91607.1 MscS Mechanosensitive ion channel [Crocosphaera chwakensis CCY0110]
MENVNLEALFIKLQEWAVTFGIQLLSAIVILIIGIQVAKFARKIAEKALKKTQVDVTIVNFLGNVVYVIVIALVTIVVLGQIGVKTASLIAILGSAGIAVGLALQGSLSNIASGIMLVIFRPFRVGDYIEGGGTAGIVKEIQIFNTILTSPDNRRIFVPNSKFFESSITNYSAEDSRRIDLVFGIGYDDDIKQAKQLLLDILAEDSRILSDPAPTVGLLELADSSVNFAVRPWVKQADFWDVYFSLQETVKQRFDEAGINIPFPQRDIHIHQS